MEINEIPQSATDNRIPFFTTSKGIVSLLGIDLVVSAAVMGAGCYFQGIFTAGFESLGTLGALTFAQDIYLRYKTDERNNDTKRLDSLERERIVREAFNFRDLRNYFR